MANSRDSLMPIFVVILALVVVVGIVYFFVAFNGLEPRQAGQNTITYVPSQMLTAQTYEVPSVSERLTLENSRLEDRVTALERQRTQLENSLSSMRFENNRLRDDLDDDHWSDCDDWDDDDCDDLEEELEDEEEENDDLRDTIEELCDELDDHNIDSDEC